MFDSILVVCEANMCRSPMAQAILARRLRGATVVSAGTRAIPGRMIDGFTSKLMAARGYDLRGHVANLIGLPQVRAAQLILTMTTMQRTTVERAYPFARGKVYRLGEHDDQDVLDPYLGSIETYETCFAQIESGVANWIQRIPKCG
jgi:protein-tyrosine phosphatase